MSNPPSGARKLRFGAFEMDLRKRELRKAGSRIKVPRLPFDILASLLDREGEIVTREEIEQRVFQEGVHTNREHAIHKAVSSLRTVLHDSRTTPRFIETLHGRGYRFLAEVHPVEERTAVQPQAASSTVPLSVADLKRVRSWRWDGQRLAERIVKFIREAIDDLTEEAHAGTPQQWRAVFWDHPESWRIIVTPRRRVVGYWHFVALSREDYASAMSGQLFDAQITADRVELFELPGEYTIYFAGLAISPAFRKPNAFFPLFASLLDVLESLARGGTFFSNVCANAFSSQGVKICKRFGLRKVGKHIDHGEIYAARLIDLLKRPVVKRNPELRRLYQEHFS